MCEHWIQYKIPLNVVKPPGLYKNIPDFSIIIIILMTVSDFLCRSHTIPEIISLKSFSQETLVALLLHRFKMERMRTCVPSKILVSSPTITVTWMAPRPNNMFVFIVFVSPAATSMVPFTVWFSR